MLALSRRCAYGAVLFGSLALVGAGYSASSHAKVPASLRPAPAATYIIGTTTGPLFYVQNNGTSPFNTYGVAGAAGAGPYAIGVLGYGANGSNANLALTGYDIGPGSIASLGDAVYAEPSNGPGSTATTGVLGLALDGDGVMGQTSVQHGCCYAGLGVPAVSNYAGIVGVDNTTNIGLNAGVIGKTSSGLYGVEGISSDDAVGGVEGVATTGDGVDAYSTYGTGLFALSSGAFYSGIYGISTADNGIGVAGKANGSTTAGYGVYAYGSNAALGGQGTTTTAILLDLFNSSGTQVMFVDSNGNIHYSGSLITSGTTQGGSVAREYVPKSTMQTIEDFGSGTLVNGTGVVHIDPSFAQMGDGAGYEVFLTPKGDSNGLYIAQENATSFVVRESKGGRSTLAFDYRIVAKQYGHSADRASIAQTASAFQSSHGATPPQLRETSPLAPARSRTAGIAANASGINPFAIPRAAAGLAHAFGH